MDNNDKLIFEKMCKYMIINYQLMESCDIISPLMSEIAKHFDLELETVKGYLLVDINGQMKPVGHWFNIFKKKYIIDATIYQYALIYEDIERMFPLYVVEDIPAGLGYQIVSRADGEGRTFKREDIERLVREIREGNDADIQRYNSEFEATKKDLFYANLF